MTIMRAKLVLQCIVQHVTSEELEFTAVCKSGTYPEDGSDEDNTYAQFTPSANLKMTVNNPALMGKFKAGQKFYVDFTEAPQ